MDQGWFWGVWWQRFEDMDLRVAFWFFLETLAIIYLNAMLLLKITTKRINLQRSSAELDRSYYPLLCLQDSHNFWLIFINKSPKHQLTRPLFLENHIESNGFPLIIMITADLSNQRNITFNTCLRVISASPAAFSRRAGLETRYP